MAKYRITAPDGNSYEVTAPDTATQEEVLDYAKKNYESSNKPSVNIGEIIKSLFQKPAAFAKDLGTNPVTMAQAIPPLAGLVGGASPIPGGSTIGTVGTRKLLSNPALRILGHPEKIPSTGEQVGEGILSALGDVIAIPAVKKSYFGRQIGRAEAAAGVPAVQDIPSVPMATGQKTIGEFINDAVESVKSSGGEGTPSYWKQIKDQVDRIYGMGKDQALTNLDKGRLKWLSQAVQEGLNASVPGRGEAASSLAKSQAIPNFIGRQVSKLPPRFKAGLGWGTGVVAPTIALEEIIRRLIKGNP